MRRLRVVTAVAVLTSIFAFQLPVFAQQPRSLVIAVPYIPASYDPDTFVPGGQQQIGNTYETLLTVATKKDDAGELAVDVASQQPGLVESFTISADATVYRFKLRKNAGSPYGNMITTADVEWTWKRGEARGATTAFARKLAGVDSLTIISPEEFEIKLDRPNTMFELWSILAVFDSVEAKKHSTADDPWAQDWLARNTAGFGAYTLQSSKPGEGAVFVANKNYFGGKPYFERVVYREVASAASRAALIKSGQVQWAEDMPLQQVIDLEKDPKVRVQKRTTFGDASLRINPRFKPFDDSRVRQAILYAMDYDAIGRIVFSGYGARARSVVSELVPGGIAANKADTDIPRAKALLAEAGYPDGIDIELIYSSNWWWEEPLAIQTREALGKAGIRVSLKSITATEMAARRVYKVSDLPFFTHLSVPGVATAMYALALNAMKDAATNTIGFNDPKMEELLEKMKVERDQGAYLKLAAEAQEFYASKFVQVDTFAPPVFAVSSPCLRNWVYRPLNTWLWKYLTCVS